MGEQIQVIKTRKAPSDTPRPGIYKTPARRSCERRRALFRLHATLALRAAQKMTVPNASLTCVLSGGRALHSSLLTARETSSNGPCHQPVLLDVAASSLVAVMTFSKGSQAAQNGHRELHALSSMLEKHAPGSARALLVSKGSRCSLSAGTPLRAWFSNGKAHCIQGPNVGAREAHTIWAYCHDFYEYLPRITVFVQDDPGLASIRRELLRPDWAVELEASFAARRRLGSARRQQHSSQQQQQQQQQQLPAPHAWVPAACACTPVREVFHVATYGGYRPMHWWMRSFLAAYANGSRPLPPQIAWPTAAQFALPRAAIRARSRRFHRLNMQLTEVPAPLKPNVERLAGESATYHPKRAKWANFGPMVVDLGEAPPRGAGHADARPGINGMDFARTLPRLPTQRARLCHAFAAAPPPQRCPELLCS